MTKMLHAFKCKCCGMVIQVQNWKDPWIKRRCGKSTKPDKLEQCIRVKEDG